MKKAFFIFLIFIFSFIAISPVRGASASLYLSPSTGTYTIGNTFSIVVKVNSGGQSINAAEASLVFNPNELEVVSLSKTGSIFTLWTTEPVFSNSLGTIEWGGGTPTSFTGASGIIITITFKAKLSGTAQVNFSSGSVLAADGQGTNVLSSMSFGTYSLFPQTITPPLEEDITPLPILGTPLVPQVSSLTHSKSNEWYSDNNPEFSWNLPSDVTDVSLLLHKNPTGNPGSISDGLIEFKKFEDVEDGIWYFHIKFKNQYGWGSIAHFKIQIDTQSPQSFEITVKDEKETVDPRPILIFETQDDLSGIEYYEVKIGEGDSFSQSASATKDNPFQMPVQSPGKQTVIVKAIDKAGNYNLAMIEINILPIETPIITDYSQELISNSTLLIKGTSLSEVSINIYLQKEREEVQVKKTKSDKQGNWSYTHDKLLEKGIYKIWAEAINSEGAKSEISEKVTISVAAPAFVRIGSLAIGYIVIIIILLFLIGVIIFAFLYIWQRLKTQKVRVTKETKEAEKVLHKVFKALRKDIKEQLEILEKAKTKRKLTREEAKIRRTLKENLIIAEKYIKKEIRDIIRQLK